MRRAVALALTCAAAAGTVIACGSSQPAAQASRHTQGNSTGAPHGSVDRRRRRVNCYEAPEKCGYPGVRNTGVANCSALPRASGPKTVTRPETIERSDITGPVVIAASNVTLNHDCVIFNGGEAAGSAAVVLENGANNFTISNTTVRAENTTSSSFEEAIRNDYSNTGALASKDRLEDCAECIHQLWTLTNSYVLSNGRAAAAGTHTEDWWFDNNAITANDDTLLNPAEQTAVVFGEDPGACENHETITNSLLAGGGYMLYFCANSTSAGTSTIKVEGNRFARCSSRSEYVAETGGYRCARGQDRHGYWPRGGYFGVVGSHYSGSEQTWKKNYWDNNLRTVHEP